MIEIKAKACKGIGKAIGVLGCGISIKHRTYGLCNKCLHDFLFNTDAGKMHFHKISMQAKLVVRKEVRKKDTETRKQLDGIPKQKKILEKEINSISRLIDKGSGCISCGGQTTPQGGHYHTVKSNGSIRYNLHNIHLQDYNCNCEKGGNIHYYDLGIIDRYGNKYWEYVKFSVVKEYPLIKFSMQDLEEAILKARKIKKDLEKSNMIFNSEQRIILRNKFNKMIGIYVELNYI